jgi:hypothetical protein
MPRPERAPSRPAFRDRPPLVRTSRDDAAPDPILLLILEPIMATSYTSSAELRAVNYGGVIRED